MVEIFSSRPFYTTYVKPPSVDNLSPKIRSNKKFWPYFKDTIGAIDGSHLLIVLPAYLASLYQNCKGFLSQNCLFTCDFNLHFTYALCYDSFLFICHSSLDSLPYLRTVLRNALHLNAASFLYAVHGSLVPFPPSLYGRPFLTRAYLNAISSLLSHCPSIPLISTLALTLRALLGPCAGSPRI